VNSVQLKRKQSEKSRFTDNESPKQSEIVVNLMNGELAEVK